MQGFKATAPVPCRTAGTKPSPHRTTRMVQLLGAAPRSRHRPASRHRMCNAGAGDECASRRSATARQRPNHPDSTLRLTDGPQDALEDVTLVIFRQRQAKVSRDVQHCRFCDLVIRAGWWFRHARLQADGAKGSSRTEREYRGQLTRLPLYKSRCCLEAETEAPASEQAAYPEQRPPAECGK